MQLFRDKMKKVNEMIECTAKLISEFNFCFCNSDESEKSTEAFCIPIFKTATEGWK